MYAESENGQTSFYVCLPEENQGSLKQFKENSNNQKGRKCFLLVIFRKRPRVDYGRDVMEGKYEIRRGT